MYKKILITGSEGFIGSHLTEYLINKNFHVRALSFYNFMGSNGWLDKINFKKKDKIEVVQGDIMDEKFVREITKDIDIVINLAALIGIPYSYKSPKSYINTNIIGTYNLLEASLLNNVKKFIQTSTSEVYGNAKSFPITENSKLNGNSPYSASKIASDQLAFSYFTSFELPVLIARPFNVYGPRQSARAIIPSIIIQILNGKRKIELGSQNTSRDFTFVSDTVKGFYKLVNHKKNYGEAFHFSNNYDVTINELVKIISNIMSVKVEIITSKKRMRPKKSEVQKLKASYHKSKKILGWSPSIPGKKGLKSGLIKTIDWLSKDDNYKFYTDRYNI